jgi:hypothetical protein
VRNGRHTLFWDDAWKQSPTWGKKDNLKPLRDHLKVKEKFGYGNTGRSILQMRYGEDGFPKDQEYN